LPSGRLYCSACNESWELREWLNTPEGRTLAGDEVADELCGTTMTMVADADADADTGSTTLPREPPYPKPLGPAAFHGLVGEVVRTIEPHSEADPAALLMQFLIAFGNKIGRKVHFRAEADHHHANLFAVLVGETSKGRKGTSLGRILKLFERCSGNDPWSNTCVQHGGLSTGEGLIWAVRDAVTKKVRRKGKGTDDDDEHEYTADEGVQDKRRLIIEAEFASVLSRSQRDGNTLTAVIREAWDHGNLQVMTKVDAAKATGAHISIIGHITRDELVRNLASTEASNGFANRFLWVATKRSKVLPDGGDPDPNKMAAVEDRLTHALASLYSMCGERTRDAAGLWRAVYPDLSAGRPGLLGAILGRGEAQVMRLALIYAAIDGSPHIRQEHLEAGLEIWRYCTDSASHVFGYTLGDPTADEILAALCEVGQAGMSRTQISAHFWRKKPVAELNRALRILEETRLVVRVAAQGSGKGRREERWRRT
jgi:hypothetical protein